MSSFLDLLFVAGRNGTCGKPGNESEPFNSTLFEEHWNSLEFVDSEESSEDGTQPVSPKH